MEKQKKYSKLYYSISEVSQMFGITNSQLRHWEKEFSQIHPQKNRNGERMYTAQDIETVRKIYLLLKDKGFTIEGAKKSLEQEHKTSEEPLQSKVKERLITKFDEIQTGLSALLEKL